MVSTSTATSLSFKPWVRDTNDRTALKDVLARVNLERGHFRDITEASLQEEIAAEGALDLTESEDDEEDGTAQDNITRQQPTTREELFSAKKDLLGHVTQAEQDILMSLDFISLLQSKQALNPAATTISPFLRNNVPIGSLGTDVWKNAPADKARESQDAMISANVRMEGLQDSADQLLAAATRLENNVRRETQYWQQILSVSQRGWSISKIPRTAHMLGVHFGFGGGAPEFARRDLAALIGDADGSINLERGIGTKPKAVLVTIWEQEKVVGVSKLPSMPDAGETTLEARIRYARDSVFDEELYHEMIREGRILASQGISTRGSAISFSTAQEAGRGQVVSFELVALDDAQAVPMSDSQQSNALAQAIVLAARLLLGQAHRERLKKRSEIPPPLTEKSEEKPIHPILRPLMLLLQHHTRLNDLNSYVDKLHAVLQRAGVEAACRPFKMPLPTMNENISSGKLIETLLHAFQSSASLDFSAPDGTSSTFEFGIESSLAYSFGALFSLTVAVGKPHRFTTVEDFFTATDDFLALDLAQAMHKIVGTGWKYDGREGTLTKSDGAGEVHYIRVEVSGRESTLRLRSSNKEFAWKAEDEQNTASFWDVARESAG